MPPLVTLIKNHDYFIGAMDAGMTLIGCSELMDEHHFRQADAQHIFSQYGTASQDYSKLFGCRLVIIISIGTCHCVVSPNTKGIY